MITIHKNTAFKHQTKSELKPPKEHFFLKKTFIYSMYMKMIWNLLEHFYFHIIVRWPLRNTDSSCKVNRVDTVALVFFLSSLCLFIELGIKKR